MDPLSLIATIGGTLLGGIFGNQAQKSEQAAQERALQQQQQQYQQGLDLLRPQIQTGDTARGYASSLLGLPGGPGAGAAENAFRASPGYQWQLNQGLEAVNQGAVNRGTLNSGATLKALQGYGSNLANQEFGNYFGRLMGLANGGAGATGQAVSLGQNFGNNAANLTQQGGQSRASYYGLLGGLGNKALTNVASMGGQGYIPPGTVY